MTITFYTCMTKKHQKSTRNQNAELKIV